MYVVPLLIFISVHRISWFWSSRSVILEQLWFIVLLISVPTPPPCLFILFFVSHVYPSMFGGFAFSLVSVMQHMLHSWAVNMLVRLWVLLFIPLALVYSIFSFVVGWFLTLLFFVLVFLFIFLNLTLLGVWFSPLCFFRIGFSWFSWFVVGSLAL